MSLGRKEVMMITASGNQRAPRPRRAALALIIIGTLLLIWSCAPDTGFNTIADYDTVVTLYDPNADFAGETTYVTYAMADSVKYLKDPDDTSTIEPDRELEELILDTIANNMDNYGYTRVTEPDPENPPDLYIPVAVTTTKWTGAYYPWYPPGWWYPWYPGWGPGWGYWPGYPPVIYSYSTGTIFFDLWDMKNADDESQTIPVIWSATINGLLSSDRAAGETRIVNSIDQAFKQSWYLNKTE
jgi:hypothetical protein